ncbi:MAG: hypothetical protein JNL82_09655 [Myxococcales bacterium]|nr:hypothetical protein [Myxococcales bacterium]
MQRTSMLRTSGSPAVVQMSTSIGPFGYVYAIGRIRPFFPSRDVEKEYQQLLPTPLPPGLTTDEQRLQYVLQKNPYLAREMGWAFAVQEVDIYRLRPQTALELDAFVAAIVPKDPTQTTYDRVVGELEPSLDGDLPGAVVNTTAQFSLKSLTADVIAALSSQGVSPLPTQAQILEIFEDMLQLADNTGDSDELRALNYVSINYPEVYVAQYGSAVPGSPATVYFAGVEVRRSALGGARTIVDVILRYENQTTGLVNRYYTSVDVSGQYPFLVTRLQPYFER